jgi:hypothetical protein
MMHAILRLIRSPAPGGVNPYTPWDKNPDGSLDVEKQ